MLTSKRKTRVAVVAAVAIGIVVLAFILPIW